MKFELFIANAKRTESAAIDLLGQWSIVVGAAADTHPEAKAQHAADPIRLSHCCLGLASELHELEFEAGTVTDINEEIGDLMWYAAIGYDALVPMCGDIDMEAVGPYVPVTIPDAFFTSEDHLRVLRNICGKFSGIAKAYTMYPRHTYKEGDGIEARAAEVMLILLQELHAYLTQAMPLWTVTELDDILAENISKLMERYPEKFSTLDANERKDKLATV